MCIRIAFGNLTFSQQLFAFLPDLKRRDCSELEGTDPKVAFRRTRARTASRFAQEIPTEKTMQTSCFCARRQMRAALQEAAALPPNSMISIKSGNAVRARSSRRGLHSSRSLKAEATTPAKHTLGSRRFRLAIVGSGPAGFYSASRILAMHGSENTTVDMYEELPVPFGLVRYGVAPDHPEVKVS